jgi:formyl-CoA transferase/CoA:oxalate CoA-transferase
VQLLEGVRVLDMGRVLSGPYCASLLAELGADVVKLESPRGDDTRHLGPFLQDESVYFAQINRGKRSIALDLKQERDRHLALRLAEKADVVVENFRPGVAARLGVDFDTLSRTNPRLVYASISGFGQTGPLAQLPAYDLVIQAMSGLMEATGTPSGPPLRVGESLADLAAGVFAAFGVCAALVQRGTTGRGQHVDVAMFDSLVALQVTAMSLLTATGELPGRVGNRHPVSTPFDTFAACDGLVAIAVANDEMFARFAKMISRPDLLQDDRYATDPMRTLNVVALKALIEEWTTSRPVSEVLRVAEEYGVPAAPVWDLKQALASEQASSRGLLGEMKHPLLGALPFLRQPVQFPGQADVPSPAVPRLDEHRAEVGADWLQQ